MSAAQYSHKVAAEASKQPVSAVFHKTRMCRFHLLGVCNRGAACLFAHNKDELLPTPDFTCTRLCERFLSTGRCDVQGCTFAHNKEELRVRKAASTSNSKKSQKAICKTAPPAESSPAPTGEVPAPVVNMPPALELTQVNLTSDKKSCGQQKKQLKDKKRFLSNGTSSWSDMVDDEDDDLDLGATTWSRQSTEDVEDLQTGASFSRFSSVDSQWQSCFEQPSCTTSSFAEVEMTVSPSNPKGTFGGLACEVKNTFLHFGDAIVFEGAGSSRVRSASAPRAFF
mmetsp:Transcript_65141/g.155536  ORF Transcript_65141/g.155536 Transcript_65141/m.155536 type:complete len:282 (+) Transcript_65141:135-980(+)